MSTNMSKMKCGTLHVCKRNNLWIVWVYDGDVAMIICIMKATLCDKTISEDLALMLRTNSEGAHVLLWTSFSQQTINEMFVFWYLHFISSRAVPLSQLSISLSLNILYLFTNYIFDKRLENDNYSQQFMVICQSAVRDRHSGRRCNHE